MHRCAFRSDSAAKLRRVRQVTEAAVFRRTSSSVLLEATMSWMILLAFVATGVVGCLSAMAGQLYERRKWERRLLERARTLESNDATPAPDRMERLELAVDAIAVELERVGEGQR